MFRGKKKDTGKEKLVFLKNVFCKLVILYLIMYMYPQKNKDEW